MRCFLNDGNRLRLIQSTVSRLSRIGEEVIISCSKESVKLRALNSTKSALPVQTFSNQFFDSYIYSTLQPSLSYQIRSSVLSRFLKDLENIESFEFNVDCNLHMLIMKTVDKFGITHVDQLYLEKTVVMEAVYSTEEYPGNSLLKCNEIAGIDSFFRGVRLISISLEEANCLTISSEDEDSAMKTSFTLKNGEFCETKITKCKSPKVLFPLRDFLIGQQLCRLDNQRMKIFIPEPGSPIVVQANMCGLVLFEMAIATLPEEEDEQHGIEQASATRISSTRVTAGSDPFSMPFNGKKRSSWFTL